MMQKILLLVVIFSLVSFGNSDRGDTAPKYFEGEVVYDIDYKPNNENITAERLKEFIGSKMVLTFKKGSYKKSYYAPSGKLLQERVLQLKEGKSYLKTADNDTIYWFDITKNDTKVTFEVKQDITYQNWYCTKIKTISKVRANPNDTTTIEVEGVNLYAKDLMVNPNWYSNYLEGNFNEIIAEGKGIAVYTSNEGLYWEQKIHIRTVERRSVKRKEISIDLLPNQPLKKL